MSLFSTIFHFSTSHLTEKNSTYRISDLTYNQVLPDIKPSLVPVRTYNILDDGTLNKIGDHNSELFKDPIVVTMGDDYNSLASKFINKIAVNNTIRTLNINDNDDTQQLIADYKPQQELLIDLFGSDSGNDKNNFITVDPSPVFSSKGYYGYDGIDTFLTNKPDTFYEISNYPYIGDITLSYSQSGDAIENKDLYLNDIERIQFSNKNLAFDLNDNAGMVAKVYGAVLGAESLADAKLIGSGLKAVDNGLNAENFATLALKSTGLETHTDIVNALWTNVVGSAPTAEQAQPYIIKLDSGEWSIGKLVLEAADNSLNEANINLVGLMSHGIEFA